MVSGAAMVRMRGSKSMDTSPKESVWSKRSKKKPKEVRGPPYMLYNAKQGEGSWVTKEILDANDAVIIKGHFITEEGYRATAIMLSDSFFRMQYKLEYKPIFRKLGLEDYFSLQPWGVDIQRCWELLTTLDDDGSALITDLDGNKVNVTITEELIEQALKLNKGERELDQTHTAKEKEEVFSTAKGQVNTFQCMVYQDVVAPLRIYMQHFKLLKPERHTAPELRLAFPFSEAHTSNVGLGYNFIKHILNDIKQHVKGLNFQKNCHLAGGHVLTRIAYHALGIIDELPPVFTASASSSKWPRSIEASPPKPERQLRGKGKEIYEESEDEGEDENDEENEDEEDQEGHDEGKSKSEGEKEPFANLPSLIPFEDPSLDEIYRNEERMRLERASAIARKKRKRIQEAHKKFELAWKEKRTKHKEDPHFVQKFDTDMEGMAPHIAALLREHMLREQLRGKEKEDELCRATTSSHRKEQEGEQPKTMEQEEKLSSPGEVAGSKENCKEGSAMGKGSADSDPTGDQDRKDTIELLEVTSQKTPQAEVTLGLTGQSGRVAHVGTLPETKTHQEEAFDLMAGTQETKKHVEEAKEVRKARAEAKEEGRREQSVEQGDQQENQNELEEPFYNFKAIVGLPLRTNASDTNTSTVTDSETKIPSQEWVRGRVIASLQSPQESAKEATQEKKGEGKIKEEEVGVLQTKPDGQEEMNEKESKEKKVASTLQMQVEGQLIPWERGRKVVKNGLRSESPSAQTDHRAVDKGKWLEQSTSQEGGLATHTISQIPLQAISSSPVGKLQSITINTNDSDEMFDSIVELLQRYKTQTMAFKNYSAILAAQEQLIQRLNAEKEDLGAKHTQAMGRISMAEAQLSELQAKYRQQEKQRQLDQLNYDKLVAVHFATVQRLENANKVLDRLAQYPLSFVTNKEAEESVVVRSLREHSIELANQLAIERLMRNTLASSFKDKESEMRSKIESLEKELVVEKLKLQSEPVCAAVQKKSKEEQVKSFPIDLNMLDSGEASTSHIEPQPIYISSEGSQKE